jgi:hypothetical protein
VAKFNITATRPATGQGPIVAEQRPSGLTHEGAPGYARDVRSELFLLAVSNMVGEDTFYEAASDRDARYRDLVHAVAGQDPEWLGRFLGWLRTEGNMRSASLVGALEAARAMLAAKTPGARQVVASVLQRADEPGEALAYWTSRYGRAIPKPVKRGIADAVRRLYSEYSLLKYDTTSKGYRFGDVLDLVHAEPVAPWQGHLFKHAIDRRHGRDWSYDEVAPLLPMVALNANLRGAASEGRPFWTNPDPDRLKAAGFTWEDVLSLAGAKADKAKLWAALIPSMGYMALLRNLRNFDEAGVPDEVAERVAARLADPEQVAKSRQFPYRFLAAYQELSSLRWGPALEKALNASLANLPALPGRSLVLVDTSASMNGLGFSARSKMTPARAAAVFGVALANRNPDGVDLHGFADGVFTHPVNRGASVLREVDRFVARTGEVGHGTRIAEAIRATYARHDRVFLISDMQTMPEVAAMQHSAGLYGVTNAVPASVPVYGFNLGGYQRTAAPFGATANRHELGGLADATFRMVPLLEAGRNADWPF